MARYFAPLGKRVEVQYRVGDLLLTATGTLVADSGKSIFLEEHFSQHGKEKTFRWEIPYQNIVQLTEVPAPTGSPEPPSPSRAAARASLTGVLPLKNRPREA